MEERAPREDILFKPVVPQALNPSALAYSNMLEHRSLEGTVIFPLGVDSVLGNWMKTLC